MKILDLHKRSTSIIVMGLLLELWSRKIKKVTSILFSRYTIAHVLHCTRKSDISGKTLSSRGLES